VVFRLGFRCRRCGRRLKRRRFHGGGMLTDGGAARTICLVPQPAAQKRPQEGARRFRVVAFYVFRTPAALGIARARQRRLYLASQRQLDSKRRAASHFRLKVYRTIQQLHSSKGAGESDAASSGLVVKNS